ncbi:MAG: hypothetical protein Q4G70_01050 [Pseudomonadota bacterium]|nr:hypothetical protein [Pseudomonadota bacterium]
MKPLLTQPELALFEASRASAIKELTARQLASKLKRARALRDKYRDVYRRQTVATRSGPAAQRASKGGENARTQVKADVMAEVLTRFEAQLAKVEAKAAQVETKKASARKVPAKKAVAKKAVAKKTTAKPITAKKATTKKTPVKKATAKSAITSAAQPAAKLVKQVRRAVKQQQAAAPVDGAPTPRRAIRAKVGGTATANAQGAVPTNMPAKTQRLNPLKAEPVNKKIHASARSRQKAVTAKRDAR